MILNCLSHSSAQTLSRVKPPEYKGLIQCHPSRPTNPVSMTSPSLMSSHSSQLTKNPPHRRQPSSEYLPVPRRASGQQSHSPLEASTFSDKSNAFKKVTQADLTDRPCAAPNDDDQGFVCSSPQSPMKTQKRKSPRSGISPLTWICYALHALLIILHTILLGMLLTEMDHRIPISPTEANFYSVLLTVMQQTFFTVVMSFWRC
jgi:hypothetical protein